ncbi:MAG: NAD(P)H-hydrate epimerase [Lachnospiraceae bacterium]|nr:NAD(P)H-hydrate epimerase [Lachnospiraceae bacterium]
MEKTISVAQMRAADQYTIENGTPSKELMGRAAQGVFDSFSSWAGKRTLIVCGSGNNGGDGYALASIMKDHELDVTVLRVSDKFSEDGDYYYQECLCQGVPVLLYRTDSVDFSDYQVIVDCMLGTGFFGIPREPIATVIKEINAVREQANTFVISVDINSGMNGDTGEAEIAVISDLTVSIGFLKHGFFLGKAPELISSLVNVDIGIQLPSE